MQPKGCNTITAWIKYNSAVLINSRVIFKYELYQKNRKYCFIYKITKIFLQNGYKT